MVYKFEKVFDKTTIQELNDIIKNYKVIHDIGINKNEDGSIYFNQYKKQLLIAYNWFLGNNHLNQIIYNPCTGGCYDGLEEKNVNLNQGAESTISYLISHLCMRELLQTKTSESNLINTQNLELVSI